MDDFTDSSGDEYKQSKYNSAISQLIRLDRLQQDCHNHARKGMFDLWNWDLDCIWVELAGDVDENSRAEKEYISINSEISNLREDIKTLKIKVTDFREKMYQILLRKEVFLKKLQNKQGKGASYYDELEDDFE